MRKRSGKIHIYTGCGKGKTTAAIGLAVRASGAGMKICIHQFIKGKACSELKALKRIKNIMVKQCGRGRFIRNKPDIKDAECARSGLKEAYRDMMSGKYDMVILDEVNVAVDLGLISADDVLGMAEDKPDFVELVFTGRGADKKLIQKAHYVTSLDKIKHPFDDGVIARKGIEY